MTVRQPPDQLSVMLTLLVGLSAALGCAQRDPVSTSPRARSAAPLSFLVGYWQDESSVNSDGQSGFRAVYSRSERGEIMSYTEYRRSGEIAFYEFERFSRVGSEFTFFPYPGGKPATPMPWASGGPTHAIFEHPTKDFPTRIEYRSPSPDRLTVTLSDPHGESDRVQRFEFHREPTP